MALLAILAAIAWGRFNKAHEQALKATLVTDLRNTATAQELYYRLYSAYANDVILLQPQMSPSPESQIHITYASSIGWAGWNEIRGTEERCELYIGSDASSALGIATDSERVYCEKP